MNPFVVGCVPYLNALPLTWRWQKLGSESPIQWVFDVPSALPGQLDSGACSAILVSSFELFTDSERVLITGNCIGTLGRVASVRLFSKVPFNQIESLALDASSMTSNALAQIILAETYGVHPITLPQPPDLRVMLTANDACLLIGDNGMTADGTGLHVLDLGAAWTEMTGLPFVWAGWMSKSDCPEALRELLAEPLDFSDDDWRAIVDHGANITRWPREVVEDYLRNVMRYPLDGLAMRGLEHFGARLRAHNLLPAPVGLS